VYTLLWWLVDLSGTCNDLRSYVQKEIMWRLKYSMPYIPLNIKNLTKLVGLFIFRVL